MCHIEASTLLEAVSIATREIRKVADVHPVRIEVDEEHRGDLEGLAASPDTWPTSHPAHWLGGCGCLGRPSKGPRSTNSCRCPEI
ncbi:hypothetical protein RCO28_33005 [Streptomyces sp. LHD-70]|uniref:hypothetical protein n=1 Tax=Streptomyces sp. LHD-70 TaxID=3072140 RepID=UPI00281031B8|nr:hypothetical protein [Streptomyces sp. LHD-70]MDQ8707252.1 hypothetical protein [Streptomyces sp. LHD-70]